MMQCVHCKCWSAYFSSSCAADGTDPRQVWICLNPDCGNEFSIDIALADEYEEDYDVPEIKEAT